MNIDSAAESDPLHNEYNCALLKVEVSGCTAITAKVQGRIDKDADWTDLNVRPVGSTTVSTSISAKGIYGVDIAGIFDIRVKITAITGTAKVVGSPAD